MATERIDWHDLPIVFVTLPTCPACGSARYIGTRSEANGDGSTTIKAVCRACSQPFKICRELPEIGNKDSGIG